MKKLIIASMFVFASMATFISPINAASITIQSDNGESDYSQTNDDHYFRRHHHTQGYFGDGQYGGNKYNSDQSWRHHRHQRCHIEVIKHWRHHHSVIEQVRVCR